MARRFQKGDKVARVGGGDVLTVVSANQVRHPVWGPTGKWWYHVVSDDGVYDLFDDCDLAPCGLGADGKVSA